MRAWSTVLGLLLIAGFTVASTPAEHVDVEASRCMDCHAEGKWNPAMQGARIDQLRFLHEDGAWFLEADLENQWRDAYQNVAGIVTAGDVLAAPPKDPVTDTYDVDMPAGVQQQVQLIEYNVRAGATHLEFKLDAAAMLPASFKLEIRTPGGELSSETEFLADDLATADHGPWTIQVTRSGASEATSVKVAATASTDALLAFAPTAGPGNMTTLRWPIAPANGTATGTLAVYYDAYYDHVDPTPESDDLDHILVSLPFQMQVDNGVPTFSEDPIERAAPDAESPGLGLAAAIGLLGAVAFLRRR